jgi:hypothetical protein
MKAPPRDALFTALVAGQVAGLAMLGTAVAFSIGRGRPFYFPLQLMTALIVGPDALTQVRVDTLVPGFLAHQLGPSILWSKAHGYLVAFRARPWRLGASLGLGIATGVIALITDVYLFMPRVQRQLHSRNLWAEHISEAGSWATHLGFGLALGYFYWRWRERGRG